MYLPLEIVEQNHSKYVGLIKQTAANECAVFDGNFYFLIHGKCSLTVVRGCVCHMFIVLSIGVYCQNEYENRTYRTELF